ncbi:Peroxisome chaperone and import receptor [Coemansia erecta]|uniref:Peroxisome chaperone and import receptor n=1 Tax=Coemansia erecta TaxID=147472 RepID=A0A9W8CVP6_9FUNG|nr:Peroxisome chaperone and import receptor [Coemansia erecta]
MSQNQHNDAELDELLDDAFEQFTIEPKAPPPSTAKKTSAQADVSTSEPAETDDKFQEEFARELAKGMEAMLKNPSLLGGAGAGEGSDLDMQKTLDDLLKQLGAVQGSTPADGKDSGASAAASATAVATEDSAKESKDEEKDLSEPATFQDKIKATMSKLKESADKAENTSGGAGGLGALGDLGMMDDLLRQMDDMGDDAQLDSLVDDVIGQLMSKEVLNQPLKDLDDAYPDYLQKNKDKLSKADYERYEKQHSYIKQILALFDEKSGDSVNDPRVATLMQEMQDCGQPPAELLKVLAPDMELNEKGEVKEPELPNCTVM